MKTVNRVLSAQLFIVMFAVLAAGTRLNGADGQCPQWDASGRWELVPEKGERIALDLKQSGSALSGAANRPPEGAAVVEGSIEKDFLKMKITWKVAGSETYIANVAADGKLTEGSGVMVDPMPRMVKWTSENALRCAK